MTEIEKMYLVRTGVSKIYLDELIMMSGLDHDLVAKMLRLDKFLLIRLKNNSNFDSSISEK